MQRRIEACGEGNRLSNKLLNLIVFQHSLIERGKLRFEAVPLTGKLIQALVDNIPIGDLDVIQEVADKAIDPLDLGVTSNSSFSGLFLLTSKLLADRRLDEDFTVALGVALVELYSRLNHRFFELLLVNCADRTDTSPVTDVAATGVVQSLLAQAVGSTRVPCVALVPTPTA